MGEIKQPFKIMLGGSPCTFWSIAQKNNRETQPSGLGWELFENYLIAKEKFKPDLFLYENNKSAAQPIKDEIKKRFGVNEGSAKYIEINSALVSAQNRQRFYVHNCGNVEQPQDRGVVLREILETTTNEQGYEMANITRIPDYGKGDKDRPITSHYPNNFGGWYNRINDPNPAKQQIDIIAEPICVNSKSGRYIKGEFVENKQPSLQDRIYDINAKSTAVTASFNPNIAEPVTVNKPLCHTIQQQVKVRKYTCDIEKLKDLLRINKKISNKEIAEKLNKPITEVEHWFRRDNCFSVPDADIWFELKKLLNIKTNEFDDFVTIFEEKDGVFEKTNRCYDVNGKMSTLMTGNSDNIIEPIRIGDIGSNSQAHRVYSTNGKNTTINAGGGGQGGKTGLYTVPYKCLNEDNVNNLFRSFGSKGKILSQDNDKTPTLLAAAGGGGGNAIYYADCVEPLVPFVEKRLDKIVDKYGYLPQMFNVYNCSEIKNKAPTQTAQCASQTKSSTVFICEKSKTQPIYEVKDGFITIKDKQYPIKLSDGYYIIRKLTVKECCRLQGMPDWWFLDNDGNKLLSDSQAYKGLGNGWQLDTVKYILEQGLRDIPRDTELQVLSLYDGIGTGRRILEELGFTNVKYYAYEIDKYCKLLTSYRYPDMIHCGDAFQVRNDDWEIEKYGEKKNENI